MVPLGPDGTDSARIRAAFGEYRRERPRDSEKARLLRERGTPEDLIGPGALSVASRALTRPRMLAATSRCSPRTTPAAAT